MPSAIARATGAEAGRISNAPGRDRIRSDTMAATPAGRRVGSLYGGARIGCRGAQLVAQLLLEQLARGVARQLVDELDGARRLEPGQVGTRERHQLLGGDRLAGSSHDDGRDPLAPTRVGQ